MGPINDENKLQVNEKNNKNWKNWKILKNNTTKTEKIEKSWNNILKFKTIRYKLTASVDIIHLILNYKFVRPFSILWQPNEWKIGKNNKIKKNEGEKCLSP